MKNDFNIFNDKLLCISIAPPLYISEIPYSISISYILLFKKVELSNKI